MCAWPEGIRASGAPYGRFRDRPETFFSFFKQVNRVRNLLPLLLVAALGAQAHARRPSAPLDVRRDKPYRVLLVVERWSDPAGILIDHAEDNFQPVAALLKAWSVPVKIFRLDHQHLDTTPLFERPGEARYGAVIWLADSPSYSGHNLAALEQAARAGTALLVLNSRFLDPTLERLLGLKFKSVYSATDPLVLNPTHFITRNLAAQENGQIDARYETSNRLWVEPCGASVLIDQAGHPVLTANRPSAECSALWLGVPKLALLRDSEEWREIFFRSLVSILGWVVLPEINYSKRVVLEIDDWGAADKGFLSYWRYRTPSEETLRANLIAPLEKRRAVVTANVVTGYVDRKTRRILSPWMQKFTDVFGIEQDYASTLRGLEAGLAAGVIDIQSHGWTHMEPDLDSPPGPWWTADLAGEASAIGWYAEFHDDRRGKDIPASVQLEHMKRSLENLERDFGVRAISLRPGNGGWSKSYENHTGRIAAQAGFGLFHAEPDFVYSLNRDMVLDMTGIAFESGAAFDRPFGFDRWPAHPDGPIFVTFHDRDISMQHEFAERLFAALPAGYATLSASEYIGMLHARVESSSAGSLELAFNFDPEYCAYFARHASRWRLWLSDAWLERIKALGEVAISLDSQAASKLKASDFLREPVALEIPAGVGRHTWKLEPAQH